MAFNKLSELQMRSKGDTAAEGSCASHKAARQHHDEKPKVKLIGNTVAQGRGGEVGSLIYSLR